MQKYRRMKCCSNRWGSLEWRKWDLAVNGATLHWMPTPSPVLGILGTQSSFNCSPGRSRSLTLSNKIIHWNESIAHIYCIIIICQKLVIFKFYYFTAKLELGKRDTNAWTWWDMELSQNEANSQKLNSAFFFFFFAGARSPGTSAITYCLQHPCSAVPKSIDKISLETSLPLWAQGCLVLP